MERQVDRVQQRDRSTFEKQKMSRKRKKRVVMTKRTTRVTDDCNLARRVLGECLFDSCDDAGCRPG